MLFSDGTTAAFGDFAGCRPNFDDDVDETSGLGSGPIGAKGDTELLLELGIAVEPAASLPEGEFKGGGAPSYGSSLTLIPRAVVAGWPPHCFCLVAAGITVGECSAGNETGLRFMIHHAALNPTRAPTTKIAIISRRDEGDCLCAISIASAGYRSRFNSPVAAAEDGDIGESICGNPVSQFWFHPAHRLFWDDAGADLSPEVENGGLLNGSILQSLSAPE